MSDSDASRPSSSAAGAMAALGEAVPDAPLNLVPENPTPTEQNAIVGRSPGQLAFLRLRRDTVAAISFIVLAFFALAAVLAPAIASLYGIKPDDRFQDKLDEIGYPLGFAGGISGEHWFGLEPQLGRDVFVQLVYGARTSLGIALAAAVLTTVIGVVVGIVSGYLGGAVDAAIGWVIDILLAFPFLIFALAAVPVVDVMMVGPDGTPSTMSRIMTLIGVFTFFGWTGTARLVRGQVLSLREREFVEAAKASGAGVGHILFRQLLPNLWAPILVTFSMAVPAYVTAEAALSFLNIGVTEPVPDWGRMIFKSNQFFQNLPTYMLFPGVAIFLLVLAFNLFGDSLRDALDPKSSRS